MSQSRSPTPTRLNRLSNSRFHSSSTTTSRHFDPSSSPAPPRRSSLDEKPSSHTYTPPEPRLRPPPLNLSSPHPLSPPPPPTLLSLSTATAPPLSGSSVETKLPDTITTSTTSTIATPSFSSKRKAVVLTTAAPVETPTTANSTTTPTDVSYYDHYSPTMSKRIRRRSPSPRRPPSTTATAATTTTTTTTTSTLLSSSTSSPSSFRRRRRDGSSGAMGGGGDCSSPSSDSQDGMLADTDSDVGKTEDTADHLPLSNVTPSADGGAVRQSQTAPTLATATTPTTTSSLASIGGGAPGPDNASTTLPPKKKRTRTLTTPHQSAVLHALLAQSRFPTTAMREEVGRSIGLSARKVQNQRQKARRPRSQGDTAATAAAARPPQYGPFPTAPEPGLVQTQTTRGFPDSATEHSTQSRSSVQEIGSRETPPRLLGPGMPGVAAAPYPPQPYRGQGHGVPVSAPPIESSHFPPGPSVHRPVSPLIYGSPRMYPPPGPRPATSHLGHAWRERDPSRTLPPLIQSRPPSSSNHAPRLPPPHGSLPPRHAPSPRLAPPPGPHPYPHPRSSSHPQPLPSPLLPPYDPITRSISPEPRFAHHPPDPSARSNHTATLPPPFTLQPPPQWDDASFSPFPRPTSSGWPRPRSRTMGGRSASPIASAYRGGTGERIGSVGSISDLSPSEARHRQIHPQSSSSHYGVPPTSSPQSMTSSSGPPSRSGRYDPVRATFIPYSSPSPIVSPSHAVNHERPGGAGGGDGSNAAGDSHHKLGGGREDR